jgi:hypothetical protein
MSSGLPHRILLDEAHYFLHGEAATELLDSSFSGYTLVTYRASRLPQALLAAAEVILVTRESDPDEVEALRRWCLRCEHVDAAGWASLARLATAQAIALPITEEAGGRLIQFTLGSRLTPHVRHREKYIDVPVPEARAFAFTVRGHRRAARTLREFVEVLEHTPDLGPYLARRDLSRWIDDVFGDHALAAELRDIEASHQSQGAPRNAVREIVDAVRRRYELGRD